MDLMVLAMARKYMDKKVAELVSAGWTKQIVKELPTTGNDKTIYMVEKIDNAGNTYYDEYMYTNGKFDGIGTTRVDLNGYATKDDLNGLKLPGLYDENNQLVMTWAEIKKAYSDAFTTVGEISSGKGFTSYFENLSGKLIIGEDISIIGNSAFAKCYNLTSVIIPDGVTNLDTCAFSQCRSLTSVTIPDSVTTIGISAFSDCKSLKSITIPDSVTNINEYTFSSCKSLTSVTIPDNVISIESNAFYYCKSLTSITIPDSVTSIGYRAFSDCTSLTDVYYEGSEEGWNAIDIGISNSSLTNATIHYNQKLATEEYINNNYASIKRIVELEEDMQRLSSAYIYKGSVYTYVDLPCGDKVLKTNFSQHHYIELSFPDNTIPKDAAKIRIEAKSSTGANYNFILTGTSNKSYNFYIQKDRYTVQTMDINDFDYSKSNGKFRISFTQNGYNILEIDKIYFLNSVGSIIKVIFTADTYTINSKGPVIDSTVTSVKIAYKNPDSAAEQKSTLQIGDVYNVSDTDKNYAWNGTDWDNLGGTFSLTNYQSKEDTRLKTTSKYIVGAINELKTLIDNQATEVEATLNAILEGEY